MLDMLLNQQICSIGSYILRICCEAIQLLWYNVEGLSLPLLWLVVLHSKAHDSPEGCHLLVVEEDTEHQGYEGQ